MNRPVSVRATAETDLVDAFDWYESQQAGLGDEFLTDFEHTQSTIRQNPESFREPRRGVRRALLSRFPYAVYFLVEPERVIIFAVVHTARHSRAWRARLT